MRMTTSGPKREQASAVRMQTDCNPNLSALIVAFQPIVFSQRFASISMQPCDALRIYYIFKGIEPGAFCPSPLGLRRTSPELACAEHRFG